MDERLVEQAYRREVARLERRQTKLDARGDNADAHRWITRTSCPPDTRLWLICGQTREPSGGGLGSAAWLPTIATVEILGPDNDLSAYSHHTFSNALWYTAVSVVPDDLWTDEVTLSFFGTDIVAAGYRGGGLQEFETPGEAEEALDTFLTDGMTYIGSPSVQLILRNNGDTFLQDQYQPIDPVNRGRSYVYRDIRGKWFL